MGERLAGGLTDRAVKSGIGLVAGTEDERALSRIFDKAASEALCEVWDETEAPADEETAEALATHLLSYLTEPPIGERLIYDSIVGDASRASEMVESMRQSGFDLDTPLAFPMEEFVCALIPAINRNIDKEMTKRGLEGVAELRIGEVLRRLEAMAGVGGRGLDTHNADNEKLHRGQRRLDDLPLYEVPQVGALPKGSVEGPGHYQLFIGREEQLKNIARILKGEEMSFRGSPAVAAVTGIGGVGKTQLASEFVCSYGQYFEGGVFWLNFSEPSGVSAEVASCGGAGGMALRDDFHRLPITEQVEAVRAEWRSEMPRLLVFDGCEDPRLLDEWRPASGGCRVLITSQRVHWDDPTLDVSLIPLEVLDEAHSLALLHKHRPDLSVADTSLRAIAKELDGLPLALDLAGRYLSIYKGDLSPGEYLEELREERRLAHESLKDTEGISPTDHVMDVWTTFNLSYKRFDASNGVDKLALELLARVRYFAPAEPISRELLLATTRWRLGKTRKGTRAFRRVVDLGLLSFVGSSPALRTHQLVHDFLQDVIEDEKAQDAVENVLAEAAEYRYSNESPLRLQLLVPHLQSVTDAAGDRDDLQAGFVFHALGIALYAMEEYRRAEVYWEKALEISKRHLGPLNPSTLQRWENVGVLKKSQGDLDGAISIYRQVLEAHERSNPSYHLALNRPERCSEQDARNISSAYLNLGSALRSKAVKFEDINLLRSVYFFYEVALKIREGKLGSDVDTAESLHNMGALMLDLLHHDGEKPPPESPVAYLQRSLQMYRSEHTGEHVYLIGPLAKLALLKEEEGKPAEASRLYEEAWQISKNTRGLGHRETDSLRRDAERLSER